MQPFGSRDYPAALLGRQGTSAHASRSIQSCRFRLPCRPSKPQPAAQPILISVTLPASHSLPQSARNKVHCQFSLRDRWCTSARNTSCSNFGCLPRATLAFNFACAGKQAAMASTHGGMATRWCLALSIRSRSTSRPSLSSHGNIAHRIARSCVESDRSASTRVIPSLCTHPTAGSLSTAPVTKKANIGNDEQSPLDTLAC